MKSRKRPLLSLAAACLSLFPAESFLGIPGNIASDNGYDNGGNEQVCWLVRSVGNADSDVVASLLEGDTQQQPIDNPLVNFTSAGNVDLYPACPQGTSLHVVPPQDVGTFGPVTQRNYTFVVNGTLDLREWPTDLVVGADNNTLEAAIHVSILEDMRFMHVVMNRSHLTVSS